MDGDFHRQPQKAKPDDGDVGRHIRRIVHPENPLDFALAFDSQVFDPPWHPAKRAFVLAHRVQEHDGRTETAFDDGLP